MNKLKKGDLLEIDVVIGAMGQCEEWEEYKVHKVKGRFFWTENDNDDFKEDSQWKFNLNTMRSVNNYLPGSYRIARIKGESDGDG